MLDHPTVVAYTHLLLRDHVLVTPQSCACTRIVQRRCPSVIRFGP